jgi:hypothetical protein
MGLHGAASISRECDAVHASLEISVRKVGRRHRHSGGQRQTWHRNQTVSHLGSRWFLRFDRPDTRDLGGAPHPGDDTATPIPHSDAIYRGQH